MLGFWHKCFYKDVIFVFLSMKKLMIRYRYTFALFYNTAHLLHDIEKLQGVQQLIFLVFIADGDNLQQIPPLFFIVHDKCISWSISKESKIRNNVKEWSLMFSFVLSNCCYPTVTAGTSFYSLALLCNIDVTFILICRWSKLHDNTMGTGGKL